LAAILKRLQLVFCEKKLEHVKSYLFSGSCLKKNPNSTKIDEDSHDENNKGVNFSFFQNQKLQYISFFQEYNTWPYESRVQ